MAPWSWTFLHKKPPKLQENDNILTHYQRAFKKGILLRQLHISQGSGANFNLIISHDDKAYICPGTSTGLLSTLSVNCRKKSMQDTFEYATFLLTCKLNIKYHSMFCCWPA